MTATIPEYQAKPTWIQYCPLSYMTHYDTSVINFHHSCSGAGTLVRTRTGAEAIETIQVGDRILSQGPAGETTIHQPILEFHNNAPHTRKPCVSHSGMRPWRPRPCIISAARGKAGRWPAI